MYNPTHTNLETEWNNILKSTGTQLLKALHKHYFKIETECERAHILAKSTLEFLEVPVPEKRRHLETLKNNRKKLSHSRRKPEREKNKQKQINPSKTKIIPPNTKHPKPHTN